MYTRLNDQRGKSMPEVWQKELRELLHKNYPAGKFTVDALIYPNELWLAAGVKVKGRGIPVTCELSLNVDPKTDMDQSLALLTDGLGRFFDDFFQDPENWDDYVPAWQADESSPLFYLVTREDLAVRQQADAWLAQHQEN